MRPFVVFGTFSPRVRNSLSAALLTWSIASCSQGGGTASVQIESILTTPGHCQYQITTAPFPTLLSANPIVGTLGKVVSSKQDLGSDPSILQNALGFSPVDTQYSQSGGSYFPLDYPTLFAASFYKAVESTYLMFSNLDPLSDLKRLVPNLSETLLVFQAKIDSGEFALDNPTDPNSDYVTDNAAYDPIPVTAPDGSIVYRNYIFSFPTDNLVSGVPLGLNPGIIGHESTHFVSQYLWRQNIDETKLSQNSQNVLGSLDEGFSDYAGFVLTGDPGFFLCTFPNENRDVSVPKVVTNDIYAAIQGDPNFDVHVGGAIWASAQYQIGNAIGQTQNLDSLVKMFSNFSACKGTDGSLDFAKLISCHLNALGGGSSAAQAIYSAAFPQYMGGGTAQ